ncbi:hypothetical protein AVEN_75421-1 [Araneus ventricosus]|uniref:Uncharacterized protein n=1 Tax=Araneus ventricosus TaxID=182803 RepID=A0A4Y2EDK0_ARAVE|nr:hypothetical protein AVEN_75421-1 [Araneus ventricosus]
MIPPLIIFIVIIILSHLKLTSVQALPPQPKKFTSPIGKHIVNQSTIVFHVTLKLTRSLKLMTVLDSSPATSPQPSICPPNPGLFLDLLDNSQALLLTK